VVNPATRTADVLAALESLREDATT